MNRFWMSWYCYDEDHRPLMYPPNEGILGWWCSGYGENNGKDAVTICAMVEAKTENEAWSAVLIDWPGIDKRFCEPQEKDEWRISNRFQLADWMIPRFKGNKKFKCSLL
jgi:hypothetical protein